MGYLVVRTLGIMAELKNIRIAVSGIYDYAKSELPTLRIAMPGTGAPDWVEDKNIYKVYRPASVLAAACSKFANLPMTHHHPKTPIDSQNFRDLAVGWTGERPETDFISETDEVGIRSTCVLYDDEALTAYERGEIQLSPGYIAVFEWNKGTDPHGNEYDIVMKEITDVNHLALLPAGRGGEYAVVMDKQPTVFDLVKTHDGAPKGNDNASKDHVKKDKPTGESGKTNDEWRKEIKEHLSSLKDKDLSNDFTGIKARLSSEGIGKMTSGPAIKKSIDNGFSGDQHFETVKRIEELYKKAKLVKVHPDKNGDKNVTMKRFVAQDKMNDGTPFDALITLKETVEHGHRIYSLELDEINKAAQRWTVNDDGTLTPENEPSTGNPTNILSDNDSNVKSIFDIAKGSVFDRVKGGILWL